ncbi:MAG: 2-oxoacid:acceptor oxidoreductase family protein [Candidatus Hydrogenedentes bacterium]|nr:2-oxoacid:acceptor oxidoreductase family protein [Candidatus Hydrogenedentota bacterium]
MKDKKEQKFKYPGVREAMDGNTAVIMCERESSDAAGAYPITPSTQMGEYWAEATAAGHVNVSGRPLIFIEPEGEHAAAAVTAGLSMTGLRSTNFSSGQGIAYMHESLYAAVGKRLTYVLNMGCRAMTKASLNVHAGHDDYHAVDDAGFFQVFGKNVQEVADLNIIAHKIAELSLNPGICAQDGFLTTHLIESCMLPERDLIAEYLGKPEDIIPCPTPAQRIMFGETRRRIPELWDVDNPVMAGTVQNQDAYMQSVAAQRPFFFDHIAEITDAAMAEFHQLTGRRYERVLTYRAEDADYLIIGQGSLIPSAEAVADYLRETRGIKVGVVNIIMFRPFPADLLGPILKGRKGVAVLERLDQPLAVDLPLIREVRATMSKCLENGLAAGGAQPHAGLAAFKKAEDAPPLYSGSYGMGSRDLQPEGLIAAVENMLPDGKKKPMYYLSIDFIRDKAYTPKQEIYQQQIQDGYPNVKELALRGSENPNLMPKDSITVRFHSVGGWGAITTGKNLAMTLFDLLGYHIKANPKYGSEKKGQPTTYYLSAAPEPIRVNCEYFYVDVVLSPDPNVFSHSNPLAGLKKGGVFIIQSEFDSAEDVWREQIPAHFQKIILDNDIQVYYLDGFKIARDIASTPELQFRMQGIAFMGVFFKASPVMKNANLTEEALFGAIEAQLQHKFGGKGARVVEGNMRVVRRGYDEVSALGKLAIAEKQASDEPRQEPLLPVMLKHQPVSDAPATDIHRFWEQTGNFYFSGKGGDNLTDPFIGVSMIPVASGVFRDMTSIRFEHPDWDPEKCTGCGSCWTICPDSSLPGLVNSVADVLETAVKRVEAAGHEAKHLRRFMRPVEKKLRDLIDAGDESGSVQAYLAEAIESAKAEAAVSDADKAELEQEVAWLREAIGTFKFSITKPFYTLNEKDAKGSGGLLSITVDPYTCKGCMECVNVCPDDALHVKTQTAETIEELRHNWDFWMALPNTKREFIRIEDLEERVGALETLLLDKQCYKAMVGGDGACLGCGEKTAVHLFTATNEALMQPRIQKHVAKLNDLIGRLERHIRLKLAESVDVADTNAINQAIDSLKDEDLTLAALSSALNVGGDGQPIDSEWLKWVTGILAKLRQLRWRYTKGITGRGRSRMGMINSTGCTSVWGSTYPFNPYPFPWANHLFQDSPSMAMGVFEGHMVKMAEGFKAIRMAELELEGGYKPEEHDEFFCYFNWRHFSDEEFLLCPPVVAIGGDGALYDIGFQNLSRMMMSGKPIKAFIVDTQVYSNTGGQACTSGFYGQVSDMAQYGKAYQGKEEVRKEIGLIAMGHRTAFVHQGSIANTGHLIEGFVRGLMARRPALFNVHTPCMPEHMIGDDLAKQQARLALESRAYPVFTYDPDLGRTPAECFDLEGNPAIDDDWPVYTLKYVEEDGSPGEMQVPMTFADFAATEGRFRKHFKSAPRDTWNDDMVPLAEFLAMDKDEREGQFPFIWAIDKKNRLTRLIVAEPLVRACEDRNDFWVMLRSLAGLDKPEIDANDIAGRARAEVVQKLTAGLLELAGASGGGATAVAVSGATAAPAGGASSAPAATGQGDTMSDDYQAPWLDSAECTGCGECMLVNPKIFGWNDHKQAVILDPKGGPYKDLVKAAEKCAARVIHPGTPADMSEKGVDKLMKRAEKYNK